MHVKTLIAATALGVIGFFAAGSIARSAPQSHATVSLRSTKLGMILVGANGHTLYLFRKDRNGTSACSAACATYWPPLLTKTKPTAGAGVHAALLGTTKRSDGHLQVTYDKHPLYSYTLDHASGQTTGEGVSAFGAKWYAVAASGSAVVKASTTSGTTTTTSTYTNPYYPPTP